MVTVHAVPARAADLYGVSCTSATFCQAVGARGPPALPRPQWNGSTWTPPDARPSVEREQRHAPRPRRARPPRSAWPSAPAPTASSSFHAYFVERVDLDRDHASLQPATSSSLPTVSVRRSDFLCRHGGQSGPGQPCLTWNGSAWSMAQNVPTPTGGGTLDGISCFSATSCAAVGTIGAATRQVLDLERPVVDAGEQPARSAPRDPPVPTCSASTA